MGKQNNNTELEFKEAKSVFNANFSETQIKKINKDVEKKLKKFEDLNALPDKSKQQLEEMIQLMQQINNGKKISDNSKA